MTSGADHYKAAEHLLKVRADALLSIKELSAEVLANPGLDNSERAEIERYADEQLFARAKDMDSMLVEAQVHATLALAAATATQLVAQYVELDDDAFAWNEAAGTPPRRTEDVPIPYCESNDCDLGVGHTGPHMHLPEVIR